MIPVEREIVGSGVVGVFDSALDCIAVMRQSLSDKPSIGDVCYSPDSLNDCVVDFTWTNCKADNQYFDRGMVHKTHDNAVLHKVFLIELSKLRG